MAPAGQLLILEAEVARRGPLDVRIQDGAVHQLARHLSPLPGETVLEARGGALLPGLHDHHLHVLALAAARQSVCCGPPVVRDLASLEAALRQVAAVAPPGAWVRGIGYHDSVAGPLERQTLDAMVPDRPVRIQHRSGRLWVFNSVGATMVGVDDPNGRLLDGDVRLRAHPSNTQPDLTGVGRWLATFGVTSVTDATPTNGPDDATRLRTGLVQEVLVMGDDRLDEGPRKIMLHDDQLPPFDQVIHTIAAAHDRHRAVAVHCVTRPALWYALAAFAEAGTIGGDRIEHGSVIPPDAVPELARLGLTVVTQPNFVAERGDQYLQDVDPDDQLWLYRVAGLLDNGIEVAGGTDAPFGDPDPWRAMRAAVDRRTPSGRMLGADERVSPETALSLFLDTSPVFGAGVRADLCLLTVPWSDARHDLSSDLVAATIRRGQLIYRRTP